MYVDGPYGRNVINCEDERYDYFIMISGGIGVTPLISITKNLLIQSNLKRAIKKIRFYHTSRNTYLQFLLDEINDLDLNNILNINFHQTKLDGG